MSWKTQSLTLIILSMGCRPSRHASGKVGDSYTGQVKEFYNDDLGRRPKNEKKGKRSTARKRPIQYSKFSTTSKTYHSTSVASKITLRLSTDGSTLQIEQYDIDLTPVEDPVTNDKHRDSRFPGGYAGMRDLATQRCDSAPQLTCVAERCISPSIVRSKTSEIKSFANNQKVCRVQVEPQSWCVASASTGVQTDGPHRPGVYRQTQENNTNSNVACERIETVETAVDMNIGNFNPTCELPTDTHTQTSNSAIDTRLFGSESNFGTPNDLHSQNGKLDDLEMNQSNRVLPVIGNHDRQAGVCRDPINESQSNSQTAAAAHQSPVLSSVHQTRHGSSCMAELNSDESRNVRSPSCQIESNNVIPRGFSSSPYGRDRTDIVGNSVNTNTESCGRSAMPQVETATLNRRVPDACDSLSGGGDGGVPVNGAISRDLSLTCTAECANRIGIVKHYAHAANSTTMYASINQSVSDSRDDHYHNPPDVSSGRALTADTACNIRDGRPATVHSVRPLGTEPNCSNYWDTTCHSKTQIQPFEPTLHKLDIQARTVTADNINPATSVVGSIRCNFPIPVSNASATGDTAISGDTITVKPCPVYNMGAVGTPDTTAAWTLDTAANGTDDADSSDDGICLSEEITLSPPAKFVHEDFQNDFGELFDETSSEPRDNTDGTRDSTNDDSEYSTSDKTENSGIEDTDNTSTDIDFSCSDDDLYYDTIEPLYI